MSMNVHTHLIVGQKLNRDTLPESLINMLDDGDEVEVNGCTLEFFDDDDHHDHPILGVSLAKTDPYGEAADLEISTAEIESLRAIVAGYVKELKYVPDVKLFMIGFWW